MTGIFWKKTITKLQNFVKTLFHIIRNIRHFMPVIIIRKDLSGSMRMTGTEVFSVWYVSHLPNETIMLFVVNYTPVERTDYRVGVPKNKQYKLIMDEHGLLPNRKYLRQRQRNVINREFSFAYPLPAYGIAVFTY